jgi:hypothetical protein
MMFVAGIVLDWVRLMNHSSEIFTFEGFRVALWVEAATLLVGALLVISSHRKANSLSTSVASKE